MSQEAQLCTRTAYGAVLCKNRNLLQGLRAGVRADGAARGGRARRGPAEPAQPLPHHQARTALSTLSDAPTVCCGCVEMLGLLMKGWL